MYEFLVHPKSYVFFHEFIYEFMIFHKFIYEFMYKLFAKTQDS